MARNMTAHFLEALKREFPFLEGWEPEFHTADRPVEFKVQRELDPNTRWSLEYGRYNDGVDTSYTNGVTWVALFGSSDVCATVNLPEGETSPEDVLRDDTTYVLARWEYRSELVYSDPGSVVYTLYKGVPETVAVIKTDVANAAARMAAELA